MRVRRTLLTGLVTVALVGGAVTAAQASSRPDRAAPADTRTAATLPQPAPCPGSPDLVCSVLRVPLDHSGRTPGHLALPVAMTPNAGAPRGILLVLAGGPGQPGVSILPRVSRWASFAQLRDEYQLVMFDERGTGATALDCPKLQVEVGSSDFWPVTPEAVAECDSRLGGQRRFYTTPDTVRDIDLLRRALGVPRMVVDGVSYGTFVAEHYALTYPHRVSGLILDSVVPHAGFAETDPVYYRAFARVLRDVCARQQCTTDPVAEINAIARQDPLVAAKLLDVLSGFSVGEPTFRPILDWIHQGASDTAWLGRLLDDGHAQFGSAPKEELSQGLHASTLCADLPHPWGTSEAPLAGRQAALDAELARLGAQAYPWTAESIRRNGIIDTCLRWSPTKASRFSRLPVLIPRTLILQGELDLFCPREWAEQELRHAVRGTLVVTPNGGHGVQGRDTSGAAAQALKELLLT